jgi:hypothetical protein
MTVYQRNGSLCGSVTEEPSRGSTVSPICRARLGLVAHEVCTMGFEYGRSFDPPVPRHGL